MISNEHGDMVFDDRLRLCILSGDNEEAQRILEEMDACTMTDSSGKTLLHVAAESQNEIITRYLIDVGCKVDAVDNDGNTPLILACLQDIYYTSDLIIALIHANASVLISNNEGKSAAEIVLGGEISDTHVFNLFLDCLQEECSNDSLRTAKELLRIGCSLTRAVRLKDVAITKYMLDNGCNVNDRDDSLKGMTPLHQALIFKDNESARLLIDRGADVNAENDDGVTPVNYACYLDILEILLNKGARIVDDNGTLVAETLFSDWEKGVVEMLIARYDLTDLSIRDRDGATLFHHLASNKIFDPLEILQKHFDYSIDINQKDSRGSTALLNAVKAGNVGTVEFVLKRGAKLTAKDAYCNEVYRALQRNIWKSNREDREKILMLLLQYGADIQWREASGDGDGGEYCTLDCTLTYRHFAMVKIILARLALVEDLGGEIKNVYRERIENNAMCKKYFEFCKRAIEKLKRVVIKRQVSLFDFLTCSEETLVEFARSEGFVATVHSMVYHKRNSNLYYYKVLRLRVKKAIEIMNLREDLFCDVNVLIPELHSNQIIIEKIVEYIVCDMLRLMARQPTFKCIIDA